MSTSMGLEDDLGSLLVLDEDGFLASVFLEEVDSLWVSLSTLDEEDLTVRLTATVSNFTE